MARKGRVDRGLVLRFDAAGEKVWYVRLYHLGKEEWFGGFNTKTDARNFYDDKKAEQRTGRFFPERYQSRSVDSVADILDRYTETLDGGGKMPTTIAEEHGRQHDGKSWALAVLHGTPLLADILDELDLFVARVRHVWRDSAVFGCGHAFAAALISTELTPH